jgi:hypothetical protein
MTVQLPTANEIWSWSQYLENGEQLCAQFIQTLTLRKEMVFTGVLYKYSRAACVYREE